MCSLFAAFSFIPVRRRACESYATQINANGNRMWLKNKTGGLSRP
ncbi:hypothetical protein HMPREF1619_01174 [Klebsiella pneumoniae 909957]|nr:hypothetical protein HMPREF1619_01174 [Klebsiella pneumoniae 909957]KXA29266.1 hypothetical protein HMPREF3197_00891 [Klebsiella pneumoniae]CCM81441.1 hypothetical protein BN426_0951 [Klebsiella pneumoniae subsp. pneumoniae ST258-K26BO]